MFWLAMTVTKKQLRISSHVKYSNGSFYCDSSLLRRCWLASTEVVLAHVVELGLAVVCVEDLESLQHIGRNGQLQDSEKHMVVVEMEPIIYLHAHDTHSAFQPQYTPCRGCWRCSARCQD